MPSGETIRAFAATGATLAVFLSVRLVDRLVSELLSPGSGYTADTPVVVAHRVSWPDERIVRSTVGGLADVVRHEGFATATLILVGPALAGAGGCRSHVYDPGYATRFRPARNKGAGW
jgi:precorrin-4/cobalt-precorrin-4 C11-methyltransferase